MRRRIGGAPPPPVFLSLTVAVVLVMLTSMAGLVSADWFAECPKECGCKWISGKKAALCTGMLLDAIPRMSSDIQHLNLSDNNIQALGERAVALAGVPHVQKLYLSRCKIREIDKSAFAELGNMIELDLSHNQIAFLHPATFKGLNRLRKLVLRGNPLGKLVAYQFPALRHLTSLDLGECRLSYVEPQAFIYLKAVEVISLRGNRFERLRREPFLPLKNLKSLELFDNPWRCDCWLKDLREWLLETKLYAAPTSCSQPERLHGRTWDTIGKDDFACKPTISVAEDVVVGYRGDNVTLSCRFSADPPASTKWVLDGRILANMSQIPFGDQLYVIAEGAGDGGGDGAGADRAAAEGADKWLNLTVTNINEQDAGDYKCVGVNPGGLAERNVTLRFQAAEPAASPVRLSMSIPVIVGIAVAAVVLTALLLILTSCAYRRRKGARPGDGVNGAGGGGGGVASTSPGKKKQNGGLVVSHHSTGSSIVGISPMRPSAMTSVPHKDQRNGGYGDGGVSYEKLPANDGDGEMEAETRLSSVGDGKSFDDHDHGMMMMADDDMMLMHGADSEEFAFLGRRRSSSQYHGGGGGGGGGNGVGRMGNNGGSGGTNGAESSSRSTRTPETASLHSDHPPGNGYGGGQNQHYPDLLDIHQGRKYSAPPSSGSYAEWPSVGPSALTTPHMQMGYVTLPRRPRASWSHPVPPVMIPPSPAPSLPPFLVPSHQQHGGGGGPSPYSDVEMMTMSPSSSAGGRYAADPVYDNLGPRTTADGTLRRPRPQQQQQQQRHPQLQHQHSLQDDGRQHHGGSYYGGGADYGPHHHGAVVAATADFGPSATDYGASRRAFQYSTLPRSTPNVSADPQYSQHYPGGYRLPPVREESHGSADGRPRIAAQNLRQKQQQQQKNGGGGGGTRPVSMTNGTPAAAMTAPETNGGGGGGDSDDADLELPPPPESLRLISPPSSNGDAGGNNTYTNNKKVPPKPPPKPKPSSSAAAAKNNASASMSVSRDSSEIFQDEGEDGTEI